MKKIKPVYSPQDIPLGLSMAMAQNVLAFDVFAKLSPVQKQQLIKDSANAHSAQEMQQLVDSMTSAGTLPGAPHINQFL
ncbi:MAG: hypothetical protein II574_06920 [Ruminococcus sp.]|nr:hypothetical protein [Ruminococcus sp.]